MSAELTEHDWDSHKATIKSLYLIENRKLQGPGGVMQEMSSTYGFKATKSQFERRFKQWGFQKNKTRDVWETLALKVTKRKRKRDRNESEVWIGVERVPVKKLRKEVSRYGYDAAFSHELEAPSPKTPEGIYICTPPALQGNMSLLYNLPWFRFLGTIESKVSTYPDLAAVAIAMVDKSTNNSVPSRPQNLQTIVWMPTILDEIISVVPTRTIISTSPTLSNTVRHIHRHLRAILPEDFDRKPTTGDEETNELIQMNENVQHLSLAVFLLTNNMLDTKKVAVMSEIFQDKRNVHLLRSLLSIENPTVEAFAEKLFLGAIQLGSPLVIQACLNAGADPNALLLGRTALQYVSGNGNIELVQILLAAGADVDAPPANGDGRTALQAAAERGNIELVQILLAAGADVNVPAANLAGVTPLQAAALNGYIRVATILLDAGADTNGNRASTRGRTALEGAAEHGRIDMVQLLLNAGAGADLYGNGDMQYKEALQLASSNGHDAVRRLIDAHYKAELQGIGIKHRSFHGHGG